MTSSKRVLHIDIETYSSTDLAACGVYRYAESSDLEVLLFGYMYEGSDTPSVVDMTQGEKIPQEVRADLIDPEVLKVAHNAAFERVVLSRWLKAYLDPMQWECTMVHALMLGLPASLADVGSVLGLEKENKAKMREGKGLVTYFCKPCRPTKANGGRMRNLPDHTPEKWAQFIEYNRQDVVAEAAIYRRLARFPMPQSERELYALDQQINDRGIPVCRPLLDSVLAFADRYNQELREQCEALTGGINVHSILQLRQWISEREGRPITDMTKGGVEALLADPTISGESKALLEIRQEASKTSVKKYQAFGRALCKDGRIHGAFQFYGAGRTGRWAGRLIQPQNFPRNSFDDIDAARDLTIAGRWDDLALLYGSINDALSTLIRTLIEAPAGASLIVADYSAIEARVTAWMADEKWRQDLFAEGGDIYCMSASQMFKVPVEKHGINAHLRKKGKVAELACGYGGGVGALRKMGGEAMGLSEEEMADIVNKWRRSSPRIVRLWRQLEDAAIEAIDNYGARIDVKHGVSFKVEAGVLFMALPSGRRLAYQRPRIDADGISFMGQNQVTRKWERISTWGGKLTENLIQAIARDCLAVALQRLNNARIRPIMHVHDEVVAVVPDVHTYAALDAMERIMAQPIDWAPGLVLTADGFASKYYRKE